MNTMEQPTFADLDYDVKKRKTRRAGWMVCPWEELEEPQGGPWASSV